MSEDLTPDEIRDADVTAGIPMAPRVLTNLPPIKAIGDPCESGCEGPCRYGNCPDCGGHSEHNWGCIHVPATH